MNDKEVQKKIFKNRLKILNVQLISFVFLAFIFVLSNISINKMKEIEVEPLITAEELGYNTEYILNSNLNKNENIYNLKLSEKGFIDRENKYIVFSITVKQLENIEEANEAFVYLIDNAKFFEREFASDCLGCSFYHDDGDVLNYVIKLDEKQLEVDRAYALYDWLNLPDSAYDLNYIFLQKGNTVIEIEFNSNLIIENETLKLFSELFERAKAILN